MSDSVRPHRRQPTRLLCPCDSPGKNTGVGCHFLLQCMKVKSESEVAQSCPTLSDPMDCSLPMECSCAPARRRVPAGSLSFAPGARSRDPTLPTEIGCGRGRFSAPRDPTEWALCSRTRTKGLKDGLRSGTVMLSY